MKKEYQEPLATLIGFMSKQNLAVIFDFDDLKEMAGNSSGNGSESGVGRSEGDIDVPAT